MKTVFVIANNLHENIMGAFRLRRLVRGLPACGWHPVVFAHDKGDRNLPGLGPGVELVNVAAPDLPALYARLTGRSAAAPRPAAPSGGPVTVRDIGVTSFLNRWCMIPDKQMLWRGPARRAVLARAAAQPPQLIFASLEPRTNLLVGADAARALNVPYIAEYRDLWTDSPYFHNEQPTTLHAALHRRLQRQVLRQATQVTCVARALGACLTRSFPAALRKPIEIHHNFFDPSEFDAVRTARPADARPFTLAYVGAMYMTRSPEAFLRGLGLFLQRRQLAPSQFRFRWIGSVTGVAGLPEVLRASGTEPYIDFVGMVPHAQALAELLACDATLILQATNDTIHIPGKLFEAMGARVPVLSVSPPCEHTELVERTGCGLHAPHDPGLIADALDQLWNWRNAGTPWPFREEDINYFRADHAIARLAGLFDRVSGATP